jgi:GAF domain-containing protein
MRAPLLLRLASVRELAPLLRATVEGLTEGGAALARVWLLEPGPGSRTLRLAASAGRSRAERGADWSRIDGAFRSFRVGSGKVGRAAASAAPVSVRDVQRAPRPIARPAWARREGIHGFAALPLLRDGRVLGVLGVFRRELLDERVLDLLGEVAGHAAAGIERAQAFGELELRAEAARRESAWLREALASERGRAELAAPDGLLSEADLRVLERENLRRILAACGGRIYGTGGAAERLGLRPTTLASRIRALGIARPGRKR